MTAAELLLRIRRLPVSAPVADLIAPPRMYASHKAHWIAWLEEYDTAGAYGRRHPGRDAKFAYNHVQNLGMVIWLAEAAGCHPDRMRIAYATAGIDHRPATQCASARRHLPWSDVLAALMKR